MMVLADESSSPFEGRGLMKVKLGEDDYEHTIWVANIGSDGILGLDFMRNSLSKDGKEEAKIWGITDLEHAKEKPRYCKASCTSTKICCDRERYMWNDGNYILWQHIVQLFYQDSESGLKLLPRITYDHIKLNSYYTMRVNLAAQPARRLPMQRREEAEQQVQKMLKDGIAEPSASPWASPIVLVRKRDGSMRFCVDYRKLNEVTVKDSYPLPTIDSCFDALSGSKLFSTLDLSSGYWQMEMDQKDKEKNAFTTSSGGLYHFTVMAFGLCNAPATFERLMEKVLSGLSWEICPKKGHLFQQSVEFLGHIVSSDGISTNPEKVKATNKELCDEQIADPDNRRLILWKETSGKRPEWSKIEAENSKTKAYWSQWDRLEMKYGILYRRWESDVGDTNEWQLVVAKALRNEVLHEMHDAKTEGHLGVTKTLGRVTQTFYWHKYSQDVKDCMVQKM
ncbi:hypothetical protein QZH41_003450 [Actinostola sp. cb2023]|nr:hypothetical protein QZH41_003450 [Actinostola sp. cb2023]